MGGSGEQGLGGGGCDRVTGPPLPRRACTVAFLFLCDGGFGIWSGGMINLVDV